MSLPALRVPYRSIETVFLDVGNTLISIDFAWVAGELGARGLTFLPDELRRAEAASRPALSRRLTGEHAQGERDPFHLYLEGILRGALPDELAGGVIEPLVSEIAAVLKPDGLSDRLWSSVMPGVPDALETLASLGLALVAVSNSDGTAERSLSRAGLRPHFAAVIDSHVVGYEKPDARIFQAALAASAAEPACTLHVGDMYHADVLGARAAGIHAVLLDPFGDWDVDDCERMTDLAELAQIMSGHRREGR